MLLELSFMDKNLAHLANAMIRLLNWCIFHLVRLGDLTLETDKYSDEKRK